jgi:hypothetical protein
MKKTISCFLALLLLSGNVYSSDIPKRPVVSTEIMNDLNKPIKRKKINSVGLTWTVVLIIVGVIIKNQPASGKTN